MNENIKEFLNILGFFKKNHLFSLIYRIIPITFENPNSASRERHGEIISVIVTGLEEETLDCR